VGSWLAASTASAEQLAPRQLALTQSFWQTILLAGCSNFYVVSRPMPFLARAFKPSKIQTIITIHHQDSLPQHCAGLHIRLAVRWQVGGDHPALAGV